MAYKKGQSGNPAGRPKGIIDRRLRFRHLLEENGEKIISKTIALALTGDLGALKICVERLIAIPKDNPLNLQLPAEATIVQAIDIVMENLKQGALTPSEAKSIADIIATKDTIARTTALKDKLESFESFMQTISNNGAVTNDQMDFNEAATRE